MNTFQNRYDSLESIIFESNLKMVAIDFHQEINTMLVVLNTGSVIHSEINITERLKGATIEQLKDYSIIAQGTGIHWPSLDEDISLKGLLRSTIQKQLNSHRELAVS
ncbi:MAG: hypothetical protein RIQ62_955 [Bacteroidota bacterium]|jgi:hypothetical protein